VSKGKRIEGKVAAVIPPFDIALNVGSREGVEEGSIALVYFVVEIKDPDTTEKLGAVQYIRGRFRVSLLSDTYCVATITDPDFVASSSIFYTNLAPTPRLKQVIERGPGQRVDERSLAGTVAIAVGDPVYFEPVGAPKSE
jgi:hypothetical protein